MDDYRTLTLCYVVERRCNLMVTIKLNQVDSKMMDWNLDNSLVYCWKWANELLLCWIRWITATRRAHLKTSSATTASARHCCGAATVTTTAVTDRTSRRRCAPTWPVRPANSAAPTSSAFRRPKCVTTTTTVTMDPTKTPLFVRLASLTTCQTLTSMTWMEQVNV